MFLVRFVWMIPRWTFDSDEAATSLEIRIQSNGVDGWKDLAMGAGGDFRYVVSNHDKYQTTKVTAAKLLRSNSSLSIAEMVKCLGKDW